MISTEKLFLILGGVNATLVVMLGAFGARALKAWLTAENNPLTETNSVPAGHS